jgi:hypothetical protein
VLGTFGHQARLAVMAMAARAGTLTLAPSPALDSDLSRLNGADVLIVFIESYGAVTYDRPAFAQAVAPGRQELTDAARETDRAVLSTFVTSPTFGGSSWLAHLSLLSAVDVRDPDTYALLMSQSRPTLVTTPWHSCPGCSRRGPKARSTGSTRCTTSWRSTTRAGRSGGGTSPISSRWPD